MKNILVVDDNQIIRDSLSAFLRHKVKDYSVLTAEDGEKAIEMLSSTPVSLILTDLEMPGVDGYQLIDYAKKKCPSAAVIIMTGSWSLDLVQLVCKMGVVRYIEKPFRFEDLAQLVTDTLEEYSKHLPFLHLSEQGRQGHA